jgi:hypothetical protein
MSTSTPLIAPKKGKYVVCLPVEGRPYIRHISSPSVSKKKLEETVQGDAQKTGRTSFVIHPMFRENNKWDIAQKILDHPNTEVWVNRNGGEDCAGNTGTILKYRHPSGCPHLFGEVALVVSKAVLEKIVDPLTFQEQLSYPKKNAVHKDCDEMCEACGCSSVEYELQDCYDGKHCLRCADEIIPETGKRRREM